MSILDAIQKFALENSRQRGRRDELVFAVTTDEARELVDELLRAQSLGEITLESGQFAAALCSPAGMRVRGVRVVAYLVMQEPRQQQRRPAAGAEYAGR